jgi:hypothetical protein
MVLLRMLFTQQNIIVYLRNKEMLLLSLSLDFVFRMVVVLRKI